MTQVWWSVSGQSGLLGHHVAAPSGPACGRSDLSEQPRPGEETTAQPPGATTLPWPVSSPGFQYPTGRGSCSSLAYK